MSAHTPPSDYHDALTGLPNRRLLDDRLRQALYLAQRRDRGIALLIIEIAGFPRFGEETVLAAARALQACVRKADTLARWGAAEFAVVMTDVQSEAHCRQVAERLLGALDVDAAIGISIFPDDAGDPEALARNADAARSRARQLGRREYRVFAR